MGRIKEIVGFKGYYITSDGRVLLSRAHKNQYGTFGWRRIFIKQRTQNSGYLICDLICDDGKKYTKTIHRLVASAFCAKEIDRSVVNHIDGNKCNNNYKNLEWCTPSENTKHAIKIGTMKIRSGFLMSEEARTKMSLFQSGRKRSEETKKKMSVAFRGRVVSEETKIKISIANTGKVTSDLTKQKLSDAMKNRYVSNETREKLRIASSGRIVSDDTKKKLSEVAKNRDRSGYKPFCKKVALIDSNGNILRVFNSMVEASIETLTNKDSISKVCNGKNKTANGMFFKIAPEMD